MVVGSDLGCLVQVGESGRGNIDKTTKIKGNKKIMNTDFAKKYK